MLEARRRQLTGSAGVCRGGRGARRHSLLCVAALLCEALRPGAAHAQNDLPLVRLQLQWFHQAQFAGYYVAHALRFYEREGVTVEFIQGGPPIPGAPAIDSLQMLAFGAADVAVAWSSSALAFRRSGGDVVNIA
jgi:NitT/TauT family transport system substrate-binding protein